MSTGCACVYTDYESMLMIAETFPRARKSHCCCECGRDVEKGEEYERAVGVNDGRIETYKTCLDCVSVRRAFFCDGWGYCAVWQDLWEHLQEVCWYGQAPGAECMGAVTPAARDKVCDLIEKIWEESAEDD
jgi:hypothetical protein